jgi:hypothetical protein
MKILSHNDRIDKTLEYRFSKADHPKLFEAIANMRHSDLYEKVDWRTYYEDSGNTLVVQINNRLFGNGKYTIELTGIEMANLMEMCCPRIEHTMQGDIYFKLRNATGSSFLSLIHTEACSGLRCSDHCSRYAMVAEPLDCIPNGAKRLYHNVKDQD